MIAESIERHEWSGVIDGWRWIVAQMDSRKWLICDRITDPLDQSDRVLGSADQYQRLIAAHEAALAVNSDLEPEVVLQRIVDVARQVVSARYAALGVANEHGKILQFITSGITPEERAAISPLPEGHGLLGALIEEGLPLLIPDIAADSRSSGFPHHHPPMRRLIGVPIKLNDSVLGDLYLTERTNGTPFTKNDLETVEFLAGHAARAIERAQLLSRSAGGANMPRNNGTNCKLSSTTYPLRLSSWLRRTEPSKWPMPPRIALKFDEAEWNPHDLVFCSAGGRPLNARNVRRTFDRICVTAGVKPISPHGIRKTHITTTIAKGANVKAVAARVGHRDITTTLKTYTALTAAMDDELMDIVGTDRVGNHAHA